MSHIKNVYLQTFPRRYMGGDIYILERRLLDALVLTLRNFAISKSSRKQSNSRCLRDVYTYILADFIRLRLYYISAWASALLVQT